MNETTTVHVISNENSVIGRFVAQLRDVEIQKDSMRFRRNLERVGEVTAYEMSKSLSYAPKSIETPLGESEMMLCTEKLVLATIFRAGIPFHNGFLNYFDDACNAFVSAYRKNHKDGSFSVNIEYVTCGDLTGKTLVLIDPMLATGSSLVLAYRALVEKGGVPAQLHVAAVIASEEGLEYARKNLPRGTQIWCAAVDQELTVKSYIVPGLGDVGDLAYGDKL